MSQRPLLLICYAAYVIRQSGIGYFPYSMDFEGL